MGSDPARLTGLATSYGPRMITGIAEALVQVAILGGTRVCNGSPEVLSMTESGPDSRQGIRGGDVILVRLSPGSVLQQGHIYRREVREKEDTNNVANNSLTKMSNV